MITADQKIRLLYSMKRIRAVEETIAERYPEGKMRCPTHLSSGQESVSAAAGLALNSDDYAVSGHRAHGHYIGKGGSVPRMLAEIYGKQTGCSAGKGGSMHLIDESVGFMGSTAIVGGTIPVGVGLALAIQFRKTKQVSCVFLGDGAVEEGVFYEAANFAALRHLPVLFLCENNFYSVYSHLRVRQPEKRKIYQLAASIGVPSAAGDGNDAELTFDLIADAIEKIRAGSGPQFLEFSAYRWREHCGPSFDNDIGYRTEEEYAYWRKLEPIDQLEKRLLASSLLQTSDIQKMETDIAAEVQAAFEFAESSPFPPASAALSDLFREDVGGTL